MIEIKKTNDKPAVFTITFQGFLSLQETNEAAQRFGAGVQALQGAPFRVLCDLSRMSAMPQEVAEVFMKAQSFAVNVGMERDAFVTRSAVIRLQISRLARENERYKKLGDIKFFDTLEAATEHILR